MSDHFVWHDLEVLLPAPRDGEASFAIASRADHKTQVNFLGDMVAHYGHAAVRDAFNKREVRNLKSLPESKRTAFLNQIAKDLRA